MKQMASSNKKKYSTNKIVPDRPNICYGKKRINNIIYSYIHTFHVLIKFICGHEFDTLRLPVNKSTATQKKNDKFIQKTRNIFFRGIEIKAKYNINSIKRVREH